MSTQKIALTRQLPEPVCQALSQFGEVTLWDPSSCQSPSIIVSTAFDDLSAEFIAQLPASVGLIANLGVGTDNINLPAASAANIHVSNTPVVTEDTADLTMALLLSTMRKLSISERLLRDDQWLAAGNHLGTRVHGKSLGIIGFGAIGQAVAMRAKGFGMSIIYHGPNRKPEAEVATGAVYCEDIDKLLSQVDVVSLNCPLTPETRHILNKDTLALTKPGCIVINTGRGALIDEQALIDALQSGHLGGAGLDVFEFEPQVTPAMLTLNNVTLLPHIGSATRECRMDIAQRALVNIKQFIETGEPVDTCY